MSDFTDIPDMPVYDDPAQGDGLTRIQWIHGAAKLRRGGHFFIPSKSLPDGFTPGKPWTNVIEVFESGEEEPGLSADTLTLAVVCVRHQSFHWSGEVGTQGRHKVWQTKWITGSNAPEHQSIQVEVLAYAEGLEELGLVVWSASTLKTGFAIIARDTTGILFNLRKYLTDPASKAAAKRIDSYAFWIEVSTERDAQGKVVYTPTKGKPVTRPVLVLPPTPDLAWARTRYLGVGDDGKALLTWLIAQRADFEPWRNERRTNDDAPLPTPVEEPARRNQPQAMDEGDYPTPF